MIFHYSLSLESYTKSVFVMHTAVHDLENKLSLAKIWMNEINS